MKLKDYSRTCIYQIDTLIHYSNTDCLSSKSLSILKRFNMPIRRIHSMYYIQCIGIYVFHSSNSCICVTKQFYKGLYLY